MFPLAFSISEIGEFESVRGSTSELSATKVWDSCGSYRRVRDALKRAGLVVAFTRDHQVRGFAQSVYQPGGVAKLPEVGKF